MLVNDFDYVLPEELIAQSPCEKRDASKLLVLQGNGDVEHRHFFDVKEYLSPGDCLVLNDSRVIPARIYGKKKKTGANIEFLLVDRLYDSRWKCLVRPGKRVPIGTEIEFSADLAARIEDTAEDGMKIVSFEFSGNFMEVLEKIGEPPLPPYIRRKPDKVDRERYQTVYSRVDGSSAAPTAGLHFTEELLEEVREMGVITAFVTLHVGLGTFRPVKAADIRDHHMHFESYSIDEENAEKINEAKKNGGRIVCVGTTSVRTLESAAVLSNRSDKYEVQAGGASTDIFIFPGYNFKMTDALITNFHLPKSTLMMLVSALAGRENIMRAYAEAIERRYRFFSYGDAMFITGK